MSSTSLYIGLSLSHISSFIKNIMVLKCDQSYEDYETLIIKGYENSKNDYGHWIFKFSVRVRFFLLRFSWNSSFPCSDLSILVSQNQNLLFNKSIITNVGLQLISTQAFDYDKGTLLSIKKCPTVISFSDLRKVLFLSVKNFVNSMLPQYFRDNKWWSW